MANKNPPANDFAPAWLKIPTYNSFKPSGASSERGTHTSRKDEHSFGFTRHKDTNPLAYHSYINDCRKEKDVNNVQYYGVDNQGLISRRPHSRHDFRISLSYAKGDNNKHMTKNGSGFYGRKGKSHDNGSVSNGGLADARGMDVTSNNFNQEFPSLQGDVSEEPTTPPALNGSAWEKPRNIKIQNPATGKKIQLVKKPVKIENPNEISRKSPASSSSGAKSSGTISSISSPHTVIVTPVAKGSSPNCRALVSAKSTLLMKPVKETLRTNGKKLGSSTSLSTHSMEILVKHPKAPGNKSEFLKTLRNETRENDENDKEFEEKGIAGKSNDSSLPSEESFENGIYLSKLCFEESDEKDKSILSSSLEAEERLLREMGWKEEVSDDETYAPLTEDEVREFRDRSEKIQKKNGIRRNLLANLSPLRLAPFPSVPPPSEISTSSSSESDSDDP